MLGEFQSDRIEGEFGIYQQAAVRNYFTSTDQVLNGLHLQSLKLFKILSFESINEHVKNTCCKGGLIEHKFMFIEKYFD